jgi:hypothetical protein
LAEIKPDSPQNALEVQAVQMAIKNAQTVDSTIEKSRGSFRARAKDFLSSL